MKKVPDTAPTVAFHVRYVPTGAVMGVYTRSPLWKELKDKPAGTRAWIGRDEYERLADD